MTDRAREIQGPWSRFAQAFQAQRGARWAWRALLLCVGLAVLAPWLANERPYYARLRDSKGFGDALALLVPISEALAREAGAGGAGFAAEARALDARIDGLDAGLESDPGDPARAALLEFKAQFERLRSAVPDAGPARVAELSQALRELAPRTQQILGGSRERLVARSHWPLFASLSWLDVSALCAWLGLAGLGLWSRPWRAAGIRARLAALVLFALALGGLSQLLPRASTALDASAWKARIAADSEARALFAPIAYGPGETRLDRALEAPLAAAGDVANSSRHWCGTDQLGRDLLARLLYAGRTSFAVAFLAALLIVSLGACLGLAAGALRGAVDLLVSRAIEVLQAFPTLVLLLGVVALLPAQLAASPWTMPLAIAAVGWTHIARLARAEALRVCELGFVQAATAAGFPRSRVLLRHVLPNSLAPVWIAASFVLSAGLVLESAAAFLGFGIQHPAPSFGALLADARATQAWWLALFPGLWLFAGILAIHLVGEGVRAALDPREGQAE